MFLKMQVQGDNADFASYIFGKNPNRHFVDNERVILSGDSVKSLGDGDVDFSLLNINELSKENLKILIKDGVFDKDLNLINENINTKYFVKNEELIRKKIGNDTESHFLYKTYSETDVEVILFTLVNSLSFSKDFNGYVNEKEYLTTSVFQSVMSDLLRTALNKEGEGYDNEYALTYEIGPFKPKVSEDTLKSLFTELGFSIDITYTSEPVSFNAKRQDIVFLKLKKYGTIRETLRQVLVLISAIDNFKHFKPKEADMLKLKKYADGWLEKHPLKKLITDRYLSYSLYSKELISEMDSQSENKSSQSLAENNNEERGYGENGLNLNTLRLLKMKEAVLNCTPTKVLDFGCGEGNLLELLAGEDMEVLGVDSSEMAVYKACKRMKKMDKVKSENIKIMQGSLYYKDSRLKDFDTVVLCEVIEHIELERVPQVIDNIMSIKPKNLIISTPNKDFNKFFENLNGELRYYDHRFEFTYNEFNSFAKEVGSKYGYEYKIETFGKEIDSIKPTMMVVFKKED